MELTQWTLFTKYFRELVTTIYRSTGNIVAATVNLIVKAWMISVPIIAVIVIVVIIRRRMREVGIPEDPTDPQDPQDPQPPT